MTDGFDIGAIDRVLLEFQDAPGRVVDQLQPPLFVDHQHAFDHARKNGLHARAVARQAVDAAAQFLHGLVHATRHAS